MRKKNLNGYFVLATSFFLSGSLFAQTTTTTTTSKTCTTKQDKRAEDKTKAIPLESCEELMVISSLNKGKSFEDVEDPKRTVDNKVTCVSRGGYTLDYDYCVKIRNLYNAVVIAEQAMQAQQKIRVTESTNKLNEEVAKAQQEGDLQNAALKANLERTKQASEHYKEQAITYTSAVAALTSGLGGWPTKSSRHFRKICGGSKAKDSGKADTEEKAEEKKETTQEGQASTGSSYFAKSVQTSKSLGFLGYSTTTDCENLLADRKGAIFSNDDARSQFWIANGQFLQKAAEAKRLAGITGDIASKQNNDPALDDDPGTGFDPCAVDQSRPECKTPGPRKPTGPNVAGGSMDFGSLGGSQAFDMGNNSGADLSGLGDSAAGSGSETVASIASPFEKQAKEATGILNPSSAASVSAGSQNSPAGGGGAGGGGGGGAGGLDDDLQGVDENADKESEITSTKISTKGGSGGGGGFQAAAKMREDNDPYASIFGAKDAAGGIEEDRSIASDIDGAGSELFQKISKRYGQIQQDKRIEGQKLE
jgi:hypothetical protein